MKKRNNKKIKLIGAILCSFFLISCGDGNKGEDNNINIEEVVLNNGAIVENKNGVYHNYNLEDGKYKKLESNKVILTYNNFSGNYISEKDGKYIGVYDNTEIDLKDIGKMDEEVTISPDGKYIYFLRDKEGYEVNILNFETGEPIPFKSNVFISGKLIDWSTNDKLVYYGINVDKNQNGIFLYDIETQSERLIYEFKNGDAEFLKGTQKGVIFIQEQLDSGKVLRKVNLETNENKILSEEIIYIYSLIESGDDLFILGKLKDNVISIYKYEEGKFKRMIYDYPSIINTEKGLRLDNEGNILFIASTNDVNKESIFKCSKDGAISSIFSEECEYFFVK